MYQTDDAFLVRTWKCLDKHSEGDGCTIADIWKQRAKQKELLAELMKKSPTLLYFPLMGRGIPIELLLTHAKVAFTRSYPGKDGNK